MRIFTLWISVSALLIGCGQGNHDGSELATALSNDTTVFSIDVSDQVAGSTYITRARQYYIVSSNDTLNFTCIFRQSVDGKLRLDLAIPYITRELYYRERLQLLRKTLRTASQEFKFDSLTSVSYGRLILSGDLAVQVTNEYAQQFGDRPRLVDYQRMQDFFASSRICTDLNTILKDYSLSTGSVGTEKLFFTTRKDLYWASKVETDSAKVPANILDCILYVRIRKISTSP